MCYELQESSGTNIWPPERMHTYRSGFCILFLTKYHVYPPVLSKWKWNCAMSMTSDHYDPGKPKQVTQITRTNNKGGKIWRRKYVNSQPVCISSREMLFFFIMVLSSRSFLSRLLEKRLKIEKELGFFRRSNVPPEATKRYFSASALKITSMHTKRTLSSVTVTIDYHY